MPRNPKNPTEYNEEPKKRSLEKLDIIFDLLLQFGYSTRKLILKRLKLNQESHHVYFKRLEDRGFIRRVEVFSIRSRFVYTLTTLGKELASEKAGNHHLSSKEAVTRINHSNLRHDLAVQKKVIELFDNYDLFLSEKYIPLASSSFEKKKPDACLIKNGEKTMLEVELTAKSDKRILKALTLHAHSLMNDVYKEVIYFFPSSTLRDYYISRFSKLEWPLGEEANNLRGRFNFLVDNFILDD